MPNKCPSSELATLNQALVRPKERTRRAVTKQDGLCVGAGAHRRSLHYAAPDFLSTLLALANFMRLSLTKAAHADGGGAPCRKSGEGLGDGSQELWSAGGAALPTFGVPRLQRSDEVANRFPSPPGLG